jgi:amino acid transporter, AAT family
MAQIKEKALLDDEQLQESQDLHRGLKDRHIQMIAIGGAIGVGLFLGSARAITKVGPMHAAVALEPGLAFSAPELTMA